MLTLAVLVFLSVSIAFAAVYLLMSSSRTDVRLRAIAGNAENPGWSATVVKIAGPLANLSAPRGEWEKSPLRIKFLNAGVRSDQARVFYFAAKSFLPIAFAAFAWYVVGPSAKTQFHQLFYVTLAATIGCYLPNALIFVLASSRREEIFDNFPDAADLMLVCVEAGLGLDAALSKVTDEIRIKCMPLAEELHLTNLEMRAGGTREQALRNLALRTGVEEVGVFAVMLTQADKFGTSIGDSLRVFSDDLRHKRQSRAEERAAKIPTKMLFPLVGCIFPSILMVVLGPAFIQIVRTILPAIGGK